MQQAATERTPIRVRGRSFMAVVLSPEAPVAAWLERLDAEVKRAPGFFVGRPVVLDMSGLPRDGTDPGALIEALQSRDVRIIGIEGAHPSWLGMESWGLPPLLGGAGRPVSNAIEVPDAAAAPAAEPAKAEPPTLLVDEPVRSGRSVVHMGGDVIVMGSVASGAEVIAGGSVHVYGALRGRAIAGLAGAGGRVFCRKLDAELLSIDGVYMTADDMPAALRGRPAQARLDGDAMVITALE